MIAGLIISILSTMSILYQIFSIEKNKAEEDQGRAVASRELYKMSPRSFVQGVVVM